MKKENEEEKQIGPGMWAWDIPEEKKQPNQEFIRKIAQESGQELYSFALLNIFETIPIKKKGT